MPGAGADSDERKGLELELIPTSLRKEELEQSCEYSLWLPCNVKYTISVQIDSEGMHGSVYDC